jgi:hypothetical protein
VMTRGPADMEEGEDSEPRSLSQGAARHRLRQGGRHPRLGTPRKDIH